MTEKQRNVQRVYGAGKCKSELLCDFILCGSQWSSSTKQMTAHEDENESKGGHSSIVEGSVQPLWKLVWQFLENQRIDRPQDLAIQHISNGQ